MKKIGCFLLVLLGAAFTYGLAQDVPVEPKFETAHVANPVTITYLDNFNKPNYQVWLFHTAKDYQTKEEVIKAVNTSKVKIWTPYSKEKIWPGVYLIVGPHGNIHTWAIKATVKKGIIVEIHE